MLKKKLILSEDIEIVATPEVAQVAPEVAVENTAPTVDNIQYSSMLNTLIKCEWDAIELYNSMIDTFKASGQMNAAQVALDIVSDDYIHVGQLEKILQQIDSNASQIEQGKIEPKGMTIEVTAPAPAPEVGQFAQPEQTPAVVVPQAPVEAPVQPVAPAQPEVQQAPVEAPQEVQPEAPVAPEQPEQPKEEAIEAPKQVDSEGKTF